MAELSLSACRLDATGRREQADRYRRLRGSVIAIERRDDALDLSFAGAVDRSLLRDAVEVERACCPFFDLRLDDDAPTLHVAVASRDVRPALDALAEAMGVEGDPKPGARA
jgi:hypothetical protein